MGRRENLTTGAERALQLLASGQTVSAAQLRAAGVERPAHVLYELELAGWPIRRTPTGWRAADPDEQRTTPAPPAPRVRRIQPT